MTIRETLKPRSTMIKQSDPDVPTTIIWSCAEDATPAGLGAETFEQALATTIGPPPRETSGLRCVRAESFRQDNDGDVMVKPFGLALEVAIDDPLALLAVTMAAIKFGHPPDVLAAAMKLVADFGKEPSR